MAKFKKINCSSSGIEKRPLLAISCWAKVNEETRPKISSLRREGGREGGNKRCLHNQRKYIQKSQQSQGVEDAGWQLCQIVILEISERNKRSNRKVYRVGSVSWLIAQHH